MQGLSQHGARCSPRAGVDFQGCCRKKPGPRDPLDPGVAIRDALRMLVT